MGAFLLMISGLIIFIKVVCGQNKRPHIILILADDLGWNDVGFHGSSEIPTPNIDALSYNGIILNNHYSQAICTPSRASLMTGKYPIHLGMQHGVIMEPEPWGLPLTEKIMPQYLQELGYESHAVGKWHLGYFKKDYTPQSRGFKSHYGFWNGYQDYYTHTVQGSFSSYEGYDMRRGYDVDWSAVGKYSTDLFTNESIRIIMNHNNSTPLFLYLAHLAPHAGNYEEPLQAPEDIVKKLSNIRDPKRRKYAGMVAKLDESVGRLLTALRTSNKLLNSIIIFLTDNGAESEGLHANSGSNWPLKGEKYTPWEGGIHTTAVVWSPLFNGKKVATGLFHISDWLPTLYSIAGGDVRDLGQIDGVNQKEVFSLDIQSKRLMILHNIDDISDYQAIRINDYKYVDGTVLLGFLDKWYNGGTKQNGKQYNITAVLNSEVSENLVRTGLILPSFDEMMSLRNKSTVRCGEQKFVPCKPFVKPCLFNIKTDPCEIHNIYEETAVSDVKIFESVLKLYRKTAIKPRNKSSDLRANPKLYNNTWVNWGDYNAGTRL